MESVDDFEISKYLKTKMKTQWMDKHKKLKELPKTGFKAHQGYASKIITGYAKNFRKRKLQKIEDNLKKSLKPGGNGRKSETNSPGVIKERNIEKEKPEERPAEAEVQEMFGGGLKKLKGVKEDKIGDIDN